MNTFIHILRQRYASVIEHRPMDADQQHEAASTLNALRLADAVLKKIKLNQEQPEHAPHIGILGPTQSGKSTLVNLLFRSESAGVSALAGYTVHAQGFTRAELSTNTHRSDALFGDFDCVPQNQLQQDNYRQYSIQHVPSPSTNSNALAETMIWDSPDFDSVESGNYRSAVLRVAALADICILMVSKDKYADKSVWDMLGLLQPLKKPLIVCINKLNSSDSKVILNSFYDRYKQHIDATTTPAVITLPYIKTLDSSASQLAQEKHAELIEAVNTELQAVSRAAQKQGAYQYISQHWDNWLEPVQAEHGANAVWRKNVDDALASGMQRYKDSYLEHPQKYDTFNRALAELLTLLEIPGLANTLGKTRKIVTWPVRKLLHIGRSAFDQTQMTEESLVDREEDALQQAAQHVLGKLNNIILDQEHGDAHAHWWTALSHSLHQKQNHLQQDFEEQIDQYQANFEPQIEAAAQKLYTSLKEQPKLLNSLRAARVSTDAAAVVLAVHSGGLAASDLVLAPAMLALTTMLTESALGKHMDSVKSDLRKIQTEQVQRQLFEGVLQAQLYNLPNALPKESGLFAIDELTVADASRQLSLEIEQSKV